MSLLYTLFGEGDELNTLQMSMRTFVLFFVALACIRLAGIRTFGRRSAYDNVIVVTFGAVLSRAVVGASPVIPVLASCLVLVLIHRLLGWLALFNDGLGKLIKGQALCLYANGKPIHKNMKKAHISWNDMEESVRRQLNTHSFAGVKEIYIERSGELSIIRY